MTDPASVLLRSSSEQIRSRLSQQTVPTSAHRVRMMAITGGTVHEKEGDTRKDYTWNPVFNRGGIYWSGPSFSSHPRQCGRAKSITRLSVPPESAVLGARPALHPRARFGDIALKKATVSKGGTTTTHPRVSPPMYRDSSPAGKLQRTHLGAPMLKSPQPPRRRASPGGAKPALRPRLSSRRAGPGPCMSSYPLPGSR